MTYNPDQTVFVNIPGTGIFPGYSCYFVWDKALLSFQLTFLLSSGSIFEHVKNMKFQRTRDMSIFGVSMKAHRSDWKNIHLGLTHCM